MALKQKDAPGRGPKRKSQRGTGSASYTVKGRRATARQRRCIDGILSQCEEDRASRRVMIAAIMCATQESVMGEAQQQTGNDDVGIFQQGRNWISVEGAKDPRKATHAFLITGPTSWKKVHGSVKKAPGDLNAALMRVQISIGGYGRWESEATRTVDTWLGEGGGDGGRGGSYNKRYSFRRGEKGGQRENSWDAAQRLVEEVGAFRWAAGNTFYAVSGDELRNARPLLTIDGSEGWLRKAPAWSWGSRRAIAEVTLEVLMDRWDVMPGGKVLLHRELGPISGTWLVHQISGSSLDSPEATVTLRRPAELRKEPASERAERNARDASSDPGGGNPTRRKGHSVPSASWNPRRKPIANWIIPILEYAAEEGWRGTVTSGYRSRAEQTAIWNSGVRPAARPGTSNHEGDEYPRGAVDVTEAQQLSAILRKSRYKDTLVFAGAKDPVHFSKPHGGSY